jgi:hypothetical protein
MPGFTYVVTAGGTLHRYPALEQCNLDNARIVESLDRLPVSRTNAPIPPGKPCLHCKPLDETFTPKRATR